MRTLSVLFCLLFLGTPAYASPVSKVKAVGGFVKRAVLFGPRFLYLQCVDQCRFNAYVAWYWDEM